jgi:hypothetical protein
MSDTNKELTPEQLEEQKQQQLLFALKKLQLVNLDNYPYRTQEKIIGKYTKEQLKKAMEAPELDVNNKTLRNISKFLYNASNHYKRIINHFATLLTFDYYIDVQGISIDDKINTKKFRKAYQDIATILENMNLKHEFGKVALHVFKEGAYAGYIHTDGEDFFLQPLDLDYVKPTYMQSGLYGISFNFQYFNVYPERIDFFPNEFRRIYNEKYSNKKARKSTALWEELSFENTIYIPFDQTVWYAIPPLVGIFADLLDIADFKELAKTKEEIDNYKLLAMKIPINEKSGEMNSYLISADHVKVFQDNVAAVVPEQIGVASMPFEIDVINFEKDSIDKNKVSQATAQMFSEAGLSQLLFSSEGTGSVGANLSIKTDENFVFPILTQLERWTNLYLKRFNKQFKFKVVMPPLTRFNFKEWVDINLKNAQFGLPVNPLFAALGLKPSATSSLLKMENELLEMKNRMIPLQSSHVGVSVDEGGRPEKDINDLSDKGMETRDSEANDNRAKFDM